jgi:hypothetical protein
MGVRMLIRRPSRRTLTDLSTQIYALLMQCCYNGPVCSRFYLRDVVTSAGQRRRKSIGFTQEELSRLFNNVLSLHHFYAVGAVIAVNGA